MSVKAREEEEVLPRDLELTGPARRYARVLALKYALATELRGVTAPGRSAYRTIQAEYGLRGNKRQVYADFLSICEEEGMEITEADVAVFTSSALNVSSQIRGAIVACAAEVTRISNYAMTGVAEMEAAADFGFILLGVLAAGKPFDVAFDWAMQVTQLDHTFTYQQAMSAKRKLMAGAPKDDKLQH